MARRSSSGHDIPLWGIFLFFFGVVFLLQTLHIIPWGLWVSLFHFWPVLIIIAGLYILLRHSHGWFATILILALLFGCLGIAIWQYGPQPVAANARSYTQPLAGLTRGTVNVNLAAGRLALASLPAGSPNLVEASSLSQGGIDVNFTNRSGEGVLNIGRERGVHEIAIEANWEMRLARNIPLSLTVKSAAGQTDLDLHDLNTTDFTLDASAGSMSVKTSAAGKGTVRASAASADVTIPDGAAVRIKASANVGSIEVNEGRFPRRGDYYVSNGYDTAASRLDLTLECNVGRIRVN